MALHSQRQISSTASLHLRGNANNAYNEVNTASHVFAGDRLTTSRTGTSIARLLRLLIASLPEIVCPGVDDNGTLSQQISSALNEWRSSESVLRERSPAQ